MKARTALTRLRDALNTAIALTLMLTAGLAADAAEDYASLPGRKALAVVPGASDRVGVAHGLTSDLQAALSALERCEAVRGEHQPACELSRLNDERITSGAEIRASRPAAEHPLHLYRIDGAGATVYLAGSVHILKASLYPLPTAYEEAFSAADHLVLEVNVGAQDPGELRRKTLAHASLPAGQRLEDVLPAPVLARLRESLARYGVQVDQVATMNPSFVMNQIVLLRLLALGYQAEHGLEQHFLRQAGQRPVLELESIEAQLALLFDQPLPLQIQLLTDTLDQEAGIEPLLADMIRAWLAGDDKGFMEMFERQSGASELSRRFTEQILDERNIGMAAGVRQLAAEGSGTYFVLVGAAHLIGEQGIPALLLRDGITCTRISSGSGIRAAAG